MPPAFCAAEGGNSLKVMANKEYRIPFVGLKLGTHAFSYDITDTFFEMFEYSLIRKGNVKVELQLEKKETMMIGQFQINGIVESECDRCSDPAEVAVKGKFQLIYKFDETPSNDETLVTIYPEDFEIDVKESILEFINVSLPTRILHKKGGCNEEMIAILNEYILFSSNDAEPEPDQNDEVDPRWAALKNMKKDDSSNDS